MAIRGFDIEANTVKFDSPNPSCLLYFKCFSLLFSLSFFLVVDLSFFPKEEQRHMQIGIFLRFTRTTVDSLLTVPPSLLFRRVIAITSSVVDVPFNNKGEPVLEIGHSSIATPYLLR